MILYKVYRANKTTITTATTRATIGSSDTHSSIDMYYDINPTDDIILLSCGGIGLCRKYSKEDIDQSKIVAAVVSYEY